MCSGMIVKVARSLWPANLKTRLGKNVVVRLGLWIALASACTSLAFAHDINLFPQMEDTNLQVLVKYGHPSNYSPARLSSLVDLAAYSPDGKRIDNVKDVKQDGDYLSWTVGKSVQPGTWLFATRYDSGFYVKTAEGRFVNTTKLEVPNAVNAARSFKFGKALFAVGAAGPGFNRIVGHRLEIVPQEDPFLAKVGGDLLVKVLFEGKPLADVGVEIGDGVTHMKEVDIPRYKTNSEGLVRVPIKGNGLRLVAVDYDVPSVTPTLASKDSYSATLVFTLKP